MKPLIVGISGATGALYGVRALFMLRELGLETHLVLSRGARLTLPEAGVRAEEVEQLATYTHHEDNLGAEISSGSFSTAGMMVMPCSMRTLGAIAQATPYNLLTRAADVTLKERRRLVVLTRETPLNLAHIRNMLAVTEMGGIVFPPVPALYQKPRSIEEMIDLTVTRVLDLFGLEAPVPTRRWSGMAGLQRG